MTTQPVENQGRHAVYTGRTTNWMMVASTCTMALFIVLMAKGSNGGRGDLLFIVPLLLVAIGSLANVLTTSNVRATAGPNGFTVRWGPLGWPRCDYPLDTIERAEVINLPWWLVSSGFWWTPKRTCCTVRRGPTVRLTLRNKRTVTVTVPEPDAAVAAINEALANRNG